jgi:hypothetical protein
VAPALGGQLVLAADQGYDMDFLGIHGRIVCAYQALCVNAHWALHLAIFH